MASLIWLIVWLVQGTPNLEWFGAWNDWAVALLACAVFACSAAERLRDVGQDGEHEWLTVEEGASLACRRRTFEWPPPTLPKERSPQRRAIATRRCR
jgi:hypothetical protein